MTLSAPSKKIEPSEFDHQAIQIFCSPNEHLDIVTFPILHKELEQRVPVFHDLLETFPISRKGFRFAKNAETKLFKHSSHSWSNHDLPTRTAHPVSNKSSFHTDPINSTCFAFSVFCLLLSILVSFNLHLFTFPQQKYQHISIHSRNFSITLTVWVDCIIYSRKPMTLLTSLKLLWLTPQMKLCSHSKYFFVMTIGLLCTREPDIPSGRSITLSTTSTSLLCTVGIQKGHPASTLITSSPNLGSTTTLPRTTVRTFSSSMHESTTRAWKCDRFMCRAYQNVLEY